MKKEIIINSTEYETRLAILEDDKMVEFSVERTDTTRMVGDIYKGKINSVLPGMQAAFVDIGMDKAAYLHSSDIGKVYNSKYSEELDDEEAPAEIIRKKKREGIEAVLKKNQEVLVQVIKEPISTKGPRIATEISIPGRFCVLVPDDDHIRVSKKISNWAERKRLRKIAEPLRPEGFGLILRTESDGKQESDLRADVKRLLKLWAKLKKKADNATPPELIHKEEELIVSMIRDIFTDDVESVVIDNRADYKKIMAYARQVMPQLKDRIKLHKSDTPIFDEYNLEPEVDKLLERKVWIRKGAYLIIDQTEAMVTIDVNTGRYTGKSDQEATIFNTNLDSAKEIARQIRLRDIGGLIVCDFIDMYNRDNRKKLYEAFKGFFQNDRAKRAINPVTDFGLVEMTRERVRPSQMHKLSEPCPSCDGSGRVLSKETLATKIERWFTRASSDRKYELFHIAITPDLADTMTNNGTSRIARVMKRHKFKINVVRDTTMSPQSYKIYDATTNEEITELYQV